MNNVGHTNWCCPALWWIAPPTPIRVCDCLLPNRHMDKATRVYIVLVSLLVLIMVKLQNNRRRVRCGDSQSWCRLCLHTSYISTTNVRSPINGRYFESIWMNTLCGGQWNHINGIYLQYMTLGSQVFTINLYLSEHQPEYRTPSHLYMIIQCRDCYAAPRCIANRI